MRTPKPYRKNGWFVTSIGGKQHQKLCRVSDGIKKARLELAKLQVSIDLNKGLPVDDSKIPYPLVGELVDNFLDHCRAETSEGTYKWYRENMQEFYLRHKDVPVNQFTYENAIQFKNYLRYEYKSKKGKPLKPSTVNHRLRPVRTMFSWANKSSRRATYGLVSNPFEEVTDLSVDSRQRILTDEEFAILCDNAISERTRDILIVLRYTTLRPGELRQLEWDHIDWENHRIVLPASIVKTRKRREVAMLTVVEEVLRKRQAASNSHLVFPNQKGKVMRNSNLSRLFAIVFNRCVKKGLIKELKGGERLVAYSTRHTRITELFVEGHSNAVVMFEAGHTNPQTTEKYKHLAASFVSETIRKNDRTTAELPQTSQEKPQ